MSTPIIKNLWIVLRVLLCVHTAVCFAADRMFSTRFTASPQAPVEITTAEQRARHQYVFMTSRIERPFSVVFYTLFGYAGLIAAAAWAAFTALRSH